MIEPGGKSSQVVVKWRLKRNAFNQVPWLPTAEAATVITWISQFKRP